MDFLIVNSPIFKQESTPPVTVESNIKYGMLYNYFAVSNEKFAPEGWHVPTLEEFQTLITALGGEEVAGGKLKETGTTYWETPNEGATNETEFNLRGNGEKQSTFDSIKTTATLATNTSGTLDVEDDAYISLNAYNDYAIIELVNNLFPKYYGTACRLIKDDSTLVDSVTDLDGNIYRTVKIGDQVWLADNWACTKLNDGTPIPYVINDTEWTVATEMAYCSYDNDLNNAFLDWEGSEVDIYLKQLNIPAYDSENSEHFLITPTNDGFDEINNPLYINFYVEPGVYDAITITQSGTTETKKTLSLYNGNNSHPASLADNAQADVKLTFSTGVHDWIVDRMSFLTVHIASPRTVVSETCHDIVLNRLHYRNFYQGIYVYGNDAALGTCTRNITIQNCYLDRQTNAGIDADQAGIMFQGTPWNSAFKITDCKVINNDIKNCNDGVMLLRSETGSGYLVDFRGMTIGYNNIWIDSDVYKDGEGNFDVNGTYAATENALDIKAGSYDSENPVKIFNNHIWGYRTTDTTGISGSGSNGEAISMHFNAVNIEINNNVVFDVKRYFNCDDHSDVIDPNYPGEFYSIRNVHLHNNIFADSLSSYNTYAWISKDVLYEKNVIQGDTYSFWVINGDETDLTIQKNVFINVGNITTRAAITPTTLINGNHFYGSSNVSNAYGTEYLTTAEANMEDYSFQYDRFTTSPQTKTITDVVSTEESPHYTDLL